MHLHIGSIRVSMFDRNCYASGQRRTSIAAAHGRRVRARLGEAVGMTCDGPRRESIAWRVGDAGAPVTVV
jgi:hypothetical protein